MLFARFDLALHVVTRTASAVAGRVAALDDKTRHYAMEGQVVIETIGDQLFEVLDGLGSNLGIKFNNDNSPIGVDRRVMACIAQCLALRGELLSSAVRVKYSDVRDSEYRRQTTPQR